MFSFLAEIVTQQCSTMDYNINYESVSNIFFGQICTIWKFLTSESTWLSCTFIYINVDQCPISTLILMCWP